MADGRRVVQHQSVQGTHEAYVQAWIWLQGHVGNITCLYHACDHQACTCLQVNEIVLGSGTAGMLCCGNQMSEHDSATAATTKP